MEILYKVWINSMHIIFDWEPYMLVHLPPFLGPNLRVVVTRPRWWGSTGRNLFPPRRLSGSSGDFGIRQWERILSASAQLGLQDFWDPLRDPLRDPLGQLPEGGLGRWSDLTVTSWWLGVGSWGPWGLGLWPYFFGIQTLLESLYQIAWHVECPLVLGVDTCIRRFLEIEFNIP